MAIGRRTVGRVILHAVPGRFSCGADCWCPDRLLLQRAGLSSQASRVV